MEELSKDETMEIIHILDQRFPNSKTELNHSNNYELLVATILSAQCTDVRVNKITEVLFKEASTPEEMLDLGFDKLSEIIKSCGFYNVKASNILKTSQILVDDYDSQVPNSMEELLKLPGVGRKTANVVLSNCFDVPAIAVDTHVFRVSNRLGICDEKDVDKTEICLMDKIDRDWWTKSHNLLILHGRRVCNARSPKCEECDLKDYCNYYKEISDQI